MSMDDLKMWGEVRQSLPAAITEGTTGPVRISKRGELVGQTLFGSKLAPMADEGSMFAAYNPTPGTAVDGIAAADGLDNTEALLYMRVNPAATKRVYLDKLWLRCVSVGTNGTNFQLALRGDKGNSRYSSGGSAITPVNMNMADSTATSVSQLYFGAVVATAATSDMRTLWHKRLRSAIKVTLDEYVFNFGGSNVTPHTAVPVATVSTLVTDCPPIVLGPGDSLLLHEFSASQSVAASYEFALSWVER